jgi:hypothetical protein
MRSRTSQPPVVAVYPSVRGGARGRLLLFIPAGACPGRRNHPRLSGRITTSNSSTPKQSKLALPHAHAVIQYGSNRHLPAEDLPRSPPVHRSDKLYVRAIRYSSVKRPVRSGTGCSPATVSCCEQHGEQVPPPGTRREAPHDGRS